MTRSKIYTHNLDHVGGSEGGRLPSVIMEIKL